MIQLFMKLWKSRIRLYRKGKKNGKIINVLQKGYKIDNKILREAKVKVGYFEEK